MTIANERGSVFEIENDIFRQRTLEIMSDGMKIIVVKGIGYVVVNEDMEDPTLFRRMGEAVAEACEDK